MLEEPKATILSHIDSANSYSFSSIEPEFDIDPFRKSLDTFIKIWKIVFIAESKSEPVASTGLFLIIKFVGNRGILGGEKKKLEYLKPVRV